MNTHEYLRSAVQTYLFTFALTVLSWAAFHNGLQIFFLPTRFFLTHVLMAVLLSSAFR
jgi:hypothetical protein